MTPSLIIPVGIPGCGKSTYAKTFFNEINDVVWSTDEIRALPQYGGDVNNQDNNDAVFHHFHGGITLDLARGRRVFADATNLTDRARRSLRTLAATNPAGPVSTHLVIFANPDEAIRRNQARDRTVPSEVMFRMLEQYERFKLTLIQEAHLYDTITEIRRFG
jgi:predicted kinase